MVGGGPTYPAEITTGWSEIFLDFAAGYHKKKKHRWVVQKAKARHTPTNFSNGIALTMLAHGKNEGWWVFQYFK